MANLSKEEEEEGKEARRVWEAVVAFFARGKLPASEQEVYAGTSLTKTQVVCGVAELRRAQVLKAASHKASLKSCEEEMEVVASKDIATARSLTSLSGSVPEEAKRLAEQCGFEEIVERWDLQTSQAAKTWVWNISQTLPFSDALFSLAREGRFQEVDAKCSDAVAATLRAWCYYKSEDWLERRRKRARGFDDRQIRTVAHALDQLLEDDRARWLAELADDDDDLGDERLGLDDRKSRELDAEPHLRQLALALRRRTSLAVRKMLVKHGVLEEEIDEVEKAVRRDEEDDEEEDDDDDAFLRDALADLVARDVPQVESDRLIPGTSAQQYAARARRRPGKHKRSGRAQTLSSRTRKITDKRCFDVNPADAWHPLAARTTPVPWTRVVENLNVAPPSSSLDSPTLQPRSPRHAKGTKAPPVPKLELPAALFPSSHLPAPAVRRLKSPYDVHDAASVRTPSPLDPEAMLLSHDAVLAAMKTRIDKLVQDAKSPRR